MLSSRGSSQPRDWTQVSSIAGRFFTSWATREAHICMKTRRQSFPPSVSLLLVCGFGRLSWSCRYRQCSAGWWQYDREPGSLTAGHTILALDDLSLNCYVRERCMLFKPLNWGSLLKHYPIEWTTSCCHICPHTSLPLCRSPTARVLSYGHHILLGTHSRVELDTPLLLDQLCTWTGWGVGVVGLLRTDFAYNLPGPSEGNGTQEALESRHILHSISFYQLVFKRWMKRMCLYWTSAYFIS